MDGHRISCGIIGSCQSAVTSEIVSRPHIARRLATAPSRWLRQELGTPCRRPSRTPLQQEVWPPGSADTVCPRPPLMTQVQYFVSRIKKGQRWDVQTMWAYDLDLSPWRSWWLLMMWVYVLHPHTNFEVLKPYRSEDMAHFVCLR